MSYYLLPKSLHLDLIAEFRPLSMIYLFMPRLNNETLLNGSFKSVKYSQELVQETSLENI